jgi:hypothetical protein
VATIQGDARGDNVTLDDVPLSMSGPDKTADWKSMSSAANFLKHADKDSDALLPLERVDNDTLLMRACSAYSSVSHAPTAEMVVYFIFWSLKPGHGLDLTGEQAEIAEHLGKLNPHRRRLACARIIRKVKKDMY